MTDSGNEDVKELLGRAFSQEPPLRIDRDEVLQQGRKRLRRRRVFEASSVVAAVLVVAVGAATLTNLADEPDRQMPPAASDTTGPPAPPSSQVPSTTITTTQQPPSSMETETSMPPPTDMSGVRAAQLTTQLYRSGLLGSVGVQPKPGNSVEPAFQIVDDTYVYEADLQDQGRSGFLQIKVDWEPNAVADCATAPPDFAPCEVKYAGNRQVMLARWKNTIGERKTYAVTVQPDGTRIVAVVSNISRTDIMYGKTPDSAVPPILDDGELCTLVAKAGLSVS